MAEKLKSKLILKTFDGSLLGLSIAPKGTASHVSFSIRYYDENDRLTAGAVHFCDVAAVDFRVNYFDNPIGAELWGCYEILDEEQKAALVEDIFQNRRRSVLLTGDYNYDPEDEADLLNHREGVERFLKVLSTYHLYQQQTQGGIYWILAKEYRVGKI